MNEKVLFYDSKNMRILRDNTADKSQTNEVTISLYDHRNDKLLHCWTVNGTDGLLNTLKNEVAPFIDKRLQKIQETVREISSRFIPFYERKRYSPAEFQLPEGISFKYNDQPNPDSHMLDRFMLGVEVKDGDDVIFTDEMTNLYAPADDFVKQMHPVIFQYQTYLLVKLGYEIGFYGDIENDLYTNVINRFSKLNHITQDWSALMSFIKTVNSIMEKYKKNAFVNSGHTEMLLNMKKALISLSEHVDDCLKGWGMDCSEGSDDTDVNDLEPGIAPGPKDMSE